LKKAIILIHGFGSDNRDFVRVIPYLSNYDTIACGNLPAHGENQETSDISADDIIEFTLDIFDKLSKTHDEVDVLGFSMGGCLASMLISKRKVHRAVLLAPANKFISTTFPITTLKIYSDLLAKEKNQALPKGKSKSKTSQAPIELNPRIKEVHKESLGTAADLLEDYKFALNKFIKDLLPKYTFHNINEFNKIVTFCNDSLVKFSTPTLILWGKIDQLVPESVVQYLLSFADSPKSRAIIYPDISHLMVYSTCYEKIMADVMDFLGEPEEQEINN
jgi:esterase/lipase